MWNYCHKLPFRYNKKKPFTDVYDIKKRCEGSWKVIQHQPNHAIIINY